MYFLALLFRQELHPVIRRLSSLLRLHYILQRRLTSTRVVTSRLTTEWPRLCHDPSSLRALSFRLHVLIGPKCQRVCYKPSRDSLLGFANPRNCLSTPDQQHLYNNLCQRARTFVALEASHKRSCWSFNPTFSFHRQYGCTAFLCLSDRS